MEWLKFKKGQGSGVRCLKHRLTQNHNSDFVSEVLYKEGYASKLM